MTTINTEEDFLRVLRENPEWREAVRSLILGEEHLHLPQALQKLTETVDRFVASQERFNEEQQRFNQNALARLGRMEGDISTLKGNYAVALAIERAELIAVECGLQYVRNMTRVELTKIAMDATGGQSLAGEWMSFREADLVIMASENAETKYLAVEVSYTAGPEDTRRALRNARILEDQTGHPARAVIASTRNTYEVQAEVDSGQVYWHFLPERVPQRG